MKYITIIALIVFCNINVQGIDKDSFFKKYPGVPYQDINIGNEIIITGTDLCSQRYDMIKPILNDFRGPFTVLDLGAAQGYFSFGIAHDFLKSICVMIDANTAYYGNHGNILFDLCHLNSHLNNFCYLNKKMTLSDLRALEQEEHFNVVLALLVVHMMANTLNEQAKIIDCLIKLADHLILEVSNNVAPDLFNYVDRLSKKMDCTYLGEVTRHRLEFCPYHQEKCPCTGKLYWLRKKSQKRKSNPWQSPLGIKKETFIKFNGIYPSLL